MAKDKISSADYEEVLDDHRRLVREIDAILNDGNAAPQASLCDLIPQIKKLVRPIDMVLFCPKCGAQHIDKPQPAKNWTNPPHRSHECQKCGSIWRPADVATNGVAQIQTKGQHDHALMLQKVHSFVMDERFVFQLTDTGKEVLAFDRGAFYVQGEKVPDGVKGVEVVFEAFKEWVLHLADEPRGRAH